jgi:hypothetical protein
MCKFIILYLFTRRDIEANIRATDVRLIGKPMTIRPWTPNATVAAWRLSASMLGSTASMPYSCATKPACKTGWPLPYSCCVKLPRLSLSKQVQDFKLRARFYSYSTLPGVFPILVACLVNQTTSPRRGLVVANLDAKEACPAATNGAGRVLRLLHHQPAHDRATTRREAQGIHTGQQVG